MKYKKEKNDARADFLLTFFDDNHRKQAIELRGFILLRYMDNATGRWRVAVYTKESYQKYLDWVTDSMPVPVDVDAKQPLID
jgi:hypothetical protein